MVIEAARRREAKQTPGFSFHFIAARQIAQTRDMSYLKEMHFDAAESHAC